MNDAMKDPVWQTLQEKIALEKENAELKRLLRQAMSDFEDTVSAVESDCYYCSSTSCLSNRRCEPKWRYAFEAEKLLNGGDEE